jgi:hypothetical protein
VLMVSCYGQPLPPQEPVPQRLLSQLSALTLTRNACAVKSRADSTSSKTGTDLAHGVPRNVHQKGLQPSRHQLLKHSALARCS